MPEAVANSEPSLQEALGAIREDWHTHRHLTIKWRNGKKRSLDQNGQSHVWYAQLARELRQEDELGWKCYCKLHHGVPILRAEDAEYREIYDSALKGLDYETKIKVMQHYPVTSLMNKTQLTKYLKAMQDDFRPKGVELKFQEP